MTLTPRQLDYHLAWQQTHLLTSYLFCHLPSQSYCKQQVLQPYLIDMSAYSHLFLVDSKKSS